MCSNTYDPLVKDVQIIVENRTNCTEQKYGADRGSFKGLVAQLWSSD